MKYKLFFAIFLSIATSTSIKQINAQEVGEIEQNLGAEANGDIKKIKEDNKGIFSATLENDLFTGTDLGYTNGVRFSYITKERKMPKIVKNASNYFPLLNKEGKKRLSFALGQNIYTPSNISKSEFIPDDFLYAGWLYGSFGVISDTGTVYDHSTLTMGVVGPSSRADQSQKFIHKSRGFQQPQGWSNQLKDEFGFTFSHERKWREIFAAKPFKMGFDIIPHAGVTLGNVHTNAAIGATFRFGYDLPADYGPTRIRPNLAGSDFFIPSEKISGYLFSIIEMRAVGRNIFLDGNTFENGPSLDKRTFVKSLQLGASITYKDIRFSYTNVFISKEFKGQKTNGTKFGAVTISYRF
jgi:hypothetical protein